MPDSQNPEHVKKLIDEFQLKGANLIPTITGEIVPTVMVADLTAEGGRSVDRLCAIGILGAAAGAGNQNTLHLANPAGSNVLAVVERIVVKQPNADIFHVAIVAGPASGAMGFYRDTRIVGTPSCQAFRNNAAAVVLDLFQFDLLAATDRDLELNFVLEPSNFIQITQQNQNETLSVNFFWRERDLLPGE